MNPLARIFNRPCTCATCGRRFTRGTGVAADYFCGRECWRIWNDIARGLGRSAA